MDITCTRRYECARARHPRVAPAMFAALWICSAWAQPPASGRNASVEPQEQFICSLPGNSSRQVGIYRPAGGRERCRVDYKRDDKTRSLWSAGHDYEFCVRKALAIVALLEQANFKCSPQTHEAPASAPTP